jgi:hypothetical protein
VQTVTKKCPLGCAVPHVHRAPSRWGLLVCGPWYWSLDSSLARAADGTPLHHVNSTPLSCGIWQDCGWLGFPVSHPLLPPPTQAEMETLRGRPRPRQRERLELLSSWERVAPSPAPVSTSGWALLPPPDPGCPEWEDRWLRDLSS